MSRINSVTAVQPSGLDVIEEGKKICPIATEEVIAALTHFQMQVNNLEQNTGIAKLSKDDKAILIQMTDEIEETLNNLNNHPSFDDLDVAIMKKMIRSLQKQREIREKGEKINLSELLFRQQRQKELNNEFLDLKKEASKSKEMAEGFGHAKIATGIALVGCTIAAIATGGATALVALGAGAASIGNGISTIGKSILDHQRDIQTGQLIGLASEREELSGDIHNEMESVMDAIRGVHRSWDDLNKLLAARLNATEGLT